MNIKKMLVLSFFGLLSALAPASAFSGSEAHRTAGNRCLEQGRTAAAISEYREALAADPSSTAVYFDLAIAYHSLSRTQEAASALEKLVELDPRDVEAYYNLGCLALYRGELGQAKLFFIKARTCRDRDPDFAPLVDQGLEFVDLISEKDPVTQKVILYSIQNGKFPSPA